MVCGFHTIRGSGRCSTGFAFVVKVGKGDVVAALALLVGSVVFSGVVAGISLVWRICR